MHFMQITDYNGYEYGKGILKIGAVVDFKKRRKGLK